jgi:two-component system, chemotaxis family, protein-glutamate methylesterase/glutaminase
MIRVVIADDSPTARELLRAILSSDPEIQVVGEARNGVEAVELTRKLRPDVVTMDIRMPQMDGFEATKEIMVTAPTPIVIVTASVAVREVETSMHTLRAGALAVLPKPPGPESPAFDAAAQELIANVKAMAQVKVVRHWRLPSNAPAPRGRGVTAGKNDSAVAGPPCRIRVVAIATSTGGPAALHRLLSALPGDFGVPVLVVQHITRGFTAGLADWLNKVSGLHVKVAEEGESLKPHTVYLAPDDRHLGVSGRSTALLSSAAPLSGFRPSGTFLFESVAGVFGAATVAVILTGRGDDGVAGLQAVRHAGGQVIAQDEDSSVIFGMPGAAVTAGLAEVVLPLDLIAARLVELVGRGAS